MKTFSIITLGCKTNQYDGQQIREFLERMGLRYVPPAHNRVDLAVANTCCVTSAAAAKSRQCVHRLQKLAAGTVVVCGCLPASKRLAVSHSDERTCCIGDRRRLAGQLRQIIRGGAATDGAEAPPVSPKPPDQAEAGDHAGATCLNLGPITRFQGHTRAFLKIQDGCDRNCSYCIIPKCRPRMESKPVDAALREAEILTRAGHREIVLTGVLLGAYGREKNNRGPRIRGSRDNQALARLLDAMAGIKGIERIRLGSLEPADITPRLLDSFRNNPKVMPHLHLCLQSGSDSILRAMRRRYTAADFLRAVDLAKSRLDRPALTADVMVGFPGETDFDFEKTVTLARKAAFAGMHVFSFSPRSGTKAAGLAGRVDAKTAAERSRILRRLDGELSLRFREQFLGQKAAVLIERGGNRARGRSERYFMVEVTGGAARRNDIVKVVITSAGGGTARAKAARYVFSL